MSSPEVHAVLALSIICVAARPPSPNMNAKREQLNPFSGRVNTLSAWQVVEAYLHWVRIILKGIPQIWK